MGVNNCLSLSAVGKHAKAKHDVARFDKRPCSLYPSLVLHFGTHSDKKACNGHGTNCKAIIGQYQFYS